METTISPQTLDSIFEGQSGVIPRDLKLNLKRTIESGALGQADALLTTLALAQSVNLSPLIEYAEANLAAAGVSGPEIQEARESAAIMGMLNTYYRFRHMTEHGDDYKTAGLRMTIFSNPVLGKARFEMLAFAVSVLNGCESCVRSHEHVLRESGVASDKIHDLVRLAATIKGASALKIGNSRSEQ
jgi:alkyl hydroperoxide reductase subunit D